MGRTSSLFVEYGGSGQCGVGEGVERVRASRKTCADVSGGIKHKGRKSFNQSNPKMKRVGFLSTRSKILTNIMRISTRGGSVKRTTIVNGCTLVKSRSEWTFAYFLLHPLCARLEKHANLSVENRAGDRRSKSNRIMSAFCV